MLIAGKESFVGHDVFVKWNAGGLNLQEWGLGV